MSTTSAATFICPKCKKKNNIEIWSSVNATQNPKLKEAIKNKSIFTYKCSYCGNMINIDYSLLYHDMHEKTLIYYANAYESDSDAYRHFITNNPFGNDASELGYITRIVQSENELIDKISIFDENLDDRIVELFKIVVLGTYLKKHSYSDRIETLYNRHKGKNFIQINVNGQYQAITEMSTNNYNKIKERYGSYLPTLPKDNLYINRKWAADFIHKGTIGPKALDTSHMGNLNSKKTEERTDDSKRLFCRKCGAELPLDSEYCNKCGTKVIR